jgi:hypothetical protein
LGGAVSGRNDQEEGIGTGTYSSCPRIDIKEPQIKRGAIRTILRASKDFELPREKEAVPYTEGMVGYRAVG